MHHPPTPSRRDFLAGAALLAGGGLLRAQAGGTPPHGPSGPVRLHHDRPTLLFGDEAVIVGNPKPGLVGDGAKRLQVRNWIAPDDSFSWEIDAPKSGEYMVTALTKSKGATLRVASGGQRIERSVETGWDRVNMGLLKLNAGVADVTLSAPQPGEKMEFYSLELIAPDCAVELAKEAAAMRSDTSWMRRAKYGLQFHWTSMSAPRSGPRKPYNEAARDFPVKAFAQKVKSMGAGYAIITTSHAQHYFPAPIKSIDRIMPGRTSERDLIRDWIDALGAEGVRLILYYHCGHDDWRNPAGWWQRCGYDPRNPRVFLDNWTSIVAEVGNRYGNGLAGWFFDDACVYYPLNPDFRALTAAAKTGNPQRVVCYNPWVLPRSTDFQDYLCGEGYGFLKLWENLPSDGSGIYADGPYAGLQAHTNFILERDWPHSRLDTEISPPRYQVDRFIEDMREGIAHGIVPSVNLEIYQDGDVGKASLEFMQAVRRALKPSA